MHVAKGELPRWFDFMISEWQDDHPDKLHPVWKLVEKPVTQGPSRASSFLRLVGAGGEGSNIKASHKKVNQPAMQ